MWWYILVACMYYDFIIKFYMFSYVVRQALFICIIVMCALSGTRRAIESDFYAPWRHPTGRSFWCQTIRWDVCPMTGGILVYPLMRCHGATHMMHSSIRAYRSFLFPSDSMVIDQGWSCFDRLVYSLSSFGRPSCLVAHSLANIYDFCYLDDEWSFVFCGR